MYSNGSLPPPSMERKVWNINFSHQILKLNLFFRWTFHSSDISVQKLNPSRILGYDPIVV